MSEEEKKKRKKSAKKVQIIGHISPKLSYSALFSNTEAKWAIFKTQPASGQLSV